MKEKKKCLMGFQKSLIIQNNYRISSFSYDRKTIPFIKNMIGLLNKMRFKHLTY